MLTAMEVYILNVSQNLKTKTFTLTLTDTWGTVLTLKPGYIKIQIAEEVYILKTTPIIVIRSWEFKYNSYFKCLLNKLLPEIKRDDKHGVNVRFTSAIWS